MHISEFKAWFEGFTEEMEKAPTEKQWKKIKAKVGEITNDYTPPTVFIDRYVRPWRRYYDDVYWSSMVSKSDRSLSNQDWRAAGRAEAKYIS